MQSIASLENYEKFINKPCPQGFCICTSYLSGLAGDFALAILHIYNLVMKCTSNTFSEQIN